MIELARKKVVISDNELEPTVLYTMKSRRFGFLRLVFLFIIFIGVAIRLPEISKYVEDYKKGEAELSVNEIIKIFYDSDKNTKTKDNNITKEDEPIEASNKYEYNEETTINNSIIEINNFKLENKVLTFEVTNLKNKVIDLEDWNYYLSVFDSNDNLIKRIKVAEDTFKAKEVVIYSYDLDSEDISYFEFNELSVNEYPAFELADNNTLMCLKTGEMVAYYYDNDSIKTIRNTVFISKDNSNYNSLLEDYKGLYIDCQLKAVPAQFNEEDNGFTYSITIDSTTTDFTKLHYKYYYSKDTAANIIKFEMESRGFNCK